MSRITKMIQDQDIQKIKEICLKLKSLLLEKIGSNFCNSIIYQNSSYLPVIIKDISIFINYLIDRDISGELWDEITKNSQKLPVNWYHCLKTTFFKAVEYHIYFREIFTLENKIKSLLEKINEEKLISLYDIKEILSIFYHKKQLKANCYTFLEYQSDLIDKFLDACFILKIRVEEDNKKETNPKQKLTNNTILSNIDNFIQKDYVEINILCKKKIEKVFEALDQIEIFSI